MLSHLRRECVGKGPLAGLQTPALRLLTSGHASLAPPAEDVLDVAIIGGGMVGAALAAALSEQHSLPPPPQHRSRPHPRVAARIRLQNAPACDTGTGDMTKHLRVAVLDRQVRLTGCEARAAQPRNQCATLPTCPR